jgi:hypothetical protein
MTYETMDIHVDIGVQIAQIANREEEKISHPSRLLQ